MTQANAFMPIKKSIQAGFESSSGLTPEFKAFATRFNEALEKELSSAGAELVSFSRGHFDCSAFYRVGDNYGYVSLPDVRGSFSSNDIMFRSAKSPKDFTGGANNWGKFDDPDLAKKMVDLIK